MISLTSTLLTFVFFHNSIKLCLSDPSYPGRLISNIGTAFEKEFKALPKIVKDAAPYAAQLPVVGPAVEIGRTIGSEMHQALKGKKTHVGQNPRPAAYPLARYPPARYPTSEYPPARYPPAEYPPARYPPAEYPPARYPAAEYPPARYPTAEYPTAGGYSTAGGYPTAERYPAASSPISPQVETGYRGRFPKTRKPGYSGIYSD